MRLDCCRPARSAPAPIFDNSAQATISGAVPGNIPEEYAPSRPIYLEGPISFEDFLADGTQMRHNLGMRPSSANDKLMWPVTSRFSFVSAVSLALIASLVMCIRAQAMDGNSTSLAQSQNLKIAHKAEDQVIRDIDTGGRIISFVCGRPKTLQILAPMDIPEVKQVRFLPQGASPIAEMKFMPAPRVKAGSGVSSAKSGQVKLDKATRDRVYNKLLKLSLADPADYETEAPSLITYFSILTGGQDQKRVEELEKILEKNLRK
ncbi:MAG: hypothetical protein IT342_07325 [Candidatus Melainabacteria bacterium]|nr:hypothetical protein [Candidatus Melainabacteria bacterium]